MPQLFKKLLENDWKSIFFGLWHVSRKYFWSAVNAVYNIKHYSGKRIYILITKIISTDSIGEARYKFVSDENLKRPIRFRLTFLIKTIFNRFTIKLSDIIFVCDLQNCPFISFLKVLKKFFFKFENRI